MDKADNSPDAKISKTETLKDQLDILKHINFDFQNLETTISSVKWEIKNAKPADETAEEFLKHSPNNAVRILYASDLHKPIFNEESEFGIAQGSVGDFFIEITDKNIVEAICKITNSPTGEAKTTQLEGIASKLGGKYKTKEVEEQSYDLLITNFEIPISKAPNIKIYARTIQKKDKGQNMFTTQSQLLFVKIPCKDITEYL